MADFSDFSAQLLIAFFGGIAAIILQWAVSWFRRPQLQISPDIISREDPIRGNEKDIGDVVAVTKSLRLKVHNNGYKAAYNCEAKVDVTDEKGKPLADTAIAHWARKTHLAHLKPEEQFVPITINSKDHELLDLVQVLVTNKLILARTYTNSPTEVKANISYCLKVTVFSDNAEPSSLSVNFSWDGKLAGFGEECLRLC